MGYAERGNKNNLTEIGGYRIKNPKLVVKLGFVLDTYKLEHLSELWKTCVEKLKGKGKHAEIVEANLFHQQEIPGPTEETTVSVRYYTPPSNRELLEKGN